MSLYLDIQRSGVRHDAWLLISQICQSDPRLLMSELADKGLFELAVRVAREFCGEREAKVRARCWQVGARERADVPSRACTVRSSRSTSVMSCIWWRLGVAKMPWRAPSSPCSWVTSLRRG